jgi:hypothetical protein
VVRATNEKHGPDIHGGNGCQPFVLDDCEVAIQGGLEVIERAAASHYVAANLLHAGGAQSSAPGANRIAIGVPNGQPSRYSLCDRRWRVVNSEYFATHLLAYQANRVTITNFRQMRLELGSTTLFVELNSVAGAEDEECSHQLV